MMKKKKKNQSSLLIIFVAAQLNYCEFRQKDDTQQQRRNLRCSLSGDGKRRNEFAERHNYTILDLYVE